MFFVILMSDDRRRCTLMLLLMMVELDDVDEMKGSLRGIDFLKSLKKTENINRHS